MRWLAISLLLACGAPAAPPQSPENHAAPKPPAKGQTFETMVVEEYADCVAPHHVVITIDAVARGTVLVPCEVKPVPHNGIVVISSEPRVTTGPVFEVEPGPHTLVVRDVETGLEAKESGTFPVYNSLEMPGTPDKALPADVLVIIVHVDWIRADVGVKANLILL